MGHNETNSTKEGGPQEQQSPASTLRQSTFGQRQIVRQNVTNACLNCKKRKAKCDGKTPCRSCTEKDRECLYEDHDARRTRINKRKLQEYQDNQDLLYSLIGSLRTSNDEQIAQITTLIRSNASLDEIRSCLAMQEIKMRLMDRQPSPEFEQLQLDLSDKSSVLNEHPRDLLQISRIADNPIVAISASPWTTVTDDDDLVSNLISLWLTWDHIWYCWVDSDLLLDALLSGDRDSLVCSPFLVNSILAWACPYSDYREARTERGTTSKLMAAFTAEAKKLLEEDIVHGPTLPTLQGLMFLFLTISLCGEDRLGYQYMLQAIEMADQLSKMETLSSPGSPEHEITPRMSKVIDLAIWGVFNVTTASYVAFMRPQIMRIPTREKPRAPFRLYGKDSWIPYPRQSTPVSAYTDELIEVMCDVAVIGTRLTQVIFAVETPQRLSLEATVTELHDELVSRIAAMPEHLQVKEGSPVSVLTHHVWYQVIVLRMFMPLRDAVPDTTSAMVERARRACIEAAQEISRICRLYQEMYGFRLMNSTLTQGTSTALYALLEEDDTVSQYHGEIINLCTALRAVSRRWPMAMAILRMVQHHAKQRKVTLPPETEKLFGEFENVDWRHAELKRLVSIYPSPPSVVASYASRATGKILDMGTFLEQMERLELGDEDQDRDHATEDAAVHDPDDLGETHPTHGD